MTKKLVIVESPAKAKTIQKYLGQEYIVKASMGHIKDLPENEFGVDIKNGFKPKYVTIKGKEKILREIKKFAQKSSEILLATDPDREGEAISWHIAKTIENSVKKKNIHRVRFHEITKQAIIEAVKNPDSIDINKVEAQQARRILDRIVGYSISPLLSKKFKKALSAGRVQSVALKLICDREKEIESFVPQEYWTLEATFSEGTVELEAKLTVVDGEKIDKFYIKNKEQAEKLKKRAESAIFSIGKVEVKERKRNPYPPFITSTLQQEASKRFGFSAKQTMLIAQQLYEGIDIGKERTGLITYMRTDSTRVSEEAIQQARKFIAESFGEEYISGNPQKEKKTKLSQDAHEAIRPTSVARTPESLKPYLTKEQFLLYDLIWRRFVASQMEPIKLLTMSIDIQSNNGLVFRSTGSTVKFDGFSKVYPIEIEQKNLPQLQKEKELKLSNIKSIQHFTEPPPRYTEGTLVKALEEKGIGRPSTYATIISNIIQRNYVRKEKQKLIPTELGKLVNAILNRLFAKIVDTDFTANMEEKLDEIETGKENWTNVLKDFYYKEFINLLENAQRELFKTSKEPTDKRCPECGSQLVRIYGKHGVFIACSNYPECKFKESNNNPIGKKCPECGSDLVIRNGKFGEFIACSSYPKCTYTESINYGPCPKCKTGKIIKKKGKSGIFFACTNYPECKFTSKQPPSQNEQHAKES